MPFRFVEENTPTQEQQGSSAKASKYRFVEEGPSKLRSVLSAAPKGFVKEFREQLLKTPIIGPGLKKLQEEQPEQAKTDEEFASEIERLLPTQEGFAEKALERGGRIAPYAIAGGGNAGAQALRSAFAGFLGQGAEEAGLPPWAQAIAELPAFAAPGLGKMIKPTKTQKELVEGARSLGLTEQEIAPLIQSEGKQKYLGKVSTRRGRTKQLLDKSYQSLGRVYNRLENNPIATKPVSHEASREVIRTIREQMDKFPSALRKIVQDDFEDLAREPITGSTLINFFKDLNYNIGKGHSQLGVLKDPIFKGIESISPELAQDFRLTNKLYSNYSKISNKLSPNLVSDLYSAGGAVRMLLGLTTGNFPILLESGLEHGGRTLARELLLNPRLQNLSKKMLTALENNKFSTANAFLKDYISEIKELNPEVANKLSTVNLESLKKE